MKNALTKLVNNIAELFKIKSLVTLGLIFGLLKLVSGKWQVSGEVLTIFSATLSGVVTYFFTKKKEDDKAEPQAETEVIVE